MIIGLSGRIGSGKDTVGKIIQDLTTPGRKISKGKGLSEQIDGNSVSAYSSMSMDTIRQYMESAGFSTSNDRIHPNPADSNTYYNPYKWDTNLKPNESSPWQIKKFSGKLKEFASMITGISVSKFEDQDFKDSKMPEEWNAIQYLEDDDEVDPTMTVREFLQRLGTGVRDTVHPNFWVNALMKEYTSPAKDYGYKVSMYGEGSNGARIVNYKQVVVQLDHSNMNPDGTYTIPERMDIPSEHWGGVISHQTFSYAIKDKPEENLWIITDVRFQNEADIIKSNGGIVVRVDRNTDASDTHISETELDNYNFDYIIKNWGDMNDLEKHTEVMLRQYNLIERK